MMGTGRERIFMIMVKRVYDPVSEGNGERILVDRLWPRGVTKEAARISSWMKELGPPTELRKWFDHDPSRWEEFRTCYMRELQSPDNQALLGDLVARSRLGVVTLVFWSQGPGTQPCHRVEKHDGRHRQENGVGLVNSIESRMIFDPRSEHVTRYMGQGYPNQPVDTAGTHPLKDANPGVGCA